VLTYLHWCDVVCISVKPTSISFIIMADLPPAYTPALAETKVVYPSTPSDQQQQQQQQQQLDYPPGYEEVTYYTPAGDEKQHPQQLVVAPEACVTVEEAEPPQSFVCHYIFSCFVIWCCAWPCGLVAFILAGN